VAVPVAVPVADPVMEPVSVAVIEPVSVAVPVVDPVVQLGIGSPTALTGTPPNDPARPRPATASTPAVTDDAT
jgi:hypothetical protein